VQKFKGLYETSKRKANHKKNSYITKYTSSKCTIFSYEIWHSAISAVIKPEGY
jgi:hypothetical protein